MILILKAGLSFKKTFFRFAVFFLLALAGCTSSSSEENKEPSEDIEQTAAEDKQEDSSIVMEDESASKEANAPASALDQAFGQNDPSAVVAAQNPALEQKIPSAQADKQEAVKETEKDSFEYRVRPKDTLSLIAKKVYKSKKMWKEVHKKNAFLKNPNRIYPGQLLSLPKLNEASEAFAKEYKDHTKTITITVKKGDTLSKLAAKHLGSGSMWKQLAEQNKDSVKNPHSIEVGQVLQLQVYGGAGPHHH